MRKPLEGLLVIALEQAVAAPYCSSRLADAGARVIKVERTEGILLEITIMWYMEKVPTLFGLIVVMCWLAPMWRT